MTTQQLLNITDDEYEKIILSNYMAWCKKHNAGKDEIMQRFLSSPILFNWWYQEYQKLEANFHKLVKPYLGIMSIDDINKMYRTEIMQIHKWYSKPLIYTSKYKVQSIVNYINN